MSPRRISSKRRPASLARARRGCVIGTHGSGLRSGRSRRVSCIRSARSSRPSISYIWSSSTSSPSRSRVEHPRRRRRGHLDADHVAEAAAPQLRLDRLEEVVGVVGHLEVGVAGDAEEHALGDLHAGEERRQEVGDHGLERHEARARVDEAVEALGHLDAGEPLLGAVRVDGEHAEREREPGDVRERLPGADGERRQHRVDVAREDGLEPLQLLRRALLDRHDLDARGGERGPQLALPELRLPARQLGDARLQRGERLRGREPVGRAHGEPRRLLAHQARRRAP